MAYRVIGVYGITPSIESIIKAAQYHGYHWLINEHGEYTDPIHWGDFENLALIEIFVDEEFSPDELSSITQADQSPYLEFYVDANGTQVLSKQRAIEAAERRVCFFLHFVDTSRPLRVGAKLLDLPPMSDLPERLVPLAHYVPVD